MRIEILYPEICTLYGDKANGRYLKECLPQEEFIYTPISEYPAFLNADIDVVYICSMSEKNQEKVIEKLNGRRAELDAAFAGNTFFLMTGNAFEIFGKRILREDKSEIAGLGVFDCYSVRQSPKRFNSLTMGNFSDTEIVGYTSRFSHTFECSETPLFEVTLGSGLNPGSKKEGIERENVWATYTLGPLLIANPYFTKKLLAKIGRPADTIPYEEAMVKAYDVKKEEYKKPGLELA
ncbi:MAG: hypothetical protein IK026_03270 [Eubacteriaceae bacterium]|nr:hypothetical protein [Eubacteriaceae bacterium]